MSIYYKDYEQELYAAANASGTTGPVSLADEVYVPIILYWHVRANTNLTVNDPITIPISNPENHDFQVSQLTKIKTAMICPLDELPLYVNDSLVCEIAKKRLKEGV